MKIPRLGGEFHNAFRNIIPVTTPIELQRLLMLPRHKERGDTSPKILLKSLGRGWLKFPCVLLGGGGAKCWKIE